MNERVFLGGAPMVGFGDENALTSYKKALLPPVVGFFAGSIAGAFVGDKIRRGVGTAAGAILGGVGGVAGGIYWVGRTALAENARIANAPAQRTVVT